MPNHIYQANQSIARARPDRVERQLENLVDDVAKDGTNVYLELSNKVITINRAMYTIYVEFLTPSLSSGNPPVISGRIKSSMQRPSGTLESCRHELAPAIGAQRKMRNVVPQQ